MKEHPIIMSGDSVRAILAGRKTQTRRLMKPQPDHCHRDIINKPRTRENWDRLLPQLGDREILCPYGASDDRLYVKESFFPDPSINGWPGDFEWNGCGRPLKGVPEQYRLPQHCLYRESWTGIELRWTSPLYMPRWASRLLLEVVNIRAERLQDISNDDAQAEGHGITWGSGCFHRSFAGAWDAINGKRASWKSNPWVWVIEFKRLPSPNPTEPSEVGR